MVNTVNGADRYDYDANGNVRLRNKDTTPQTLGWNVENRLQSVAATGLTESYLYDENGSRVKKTSNGVATFYPFPHYEVSGSTTTKYYFFNGQRVAMKVGSTLTYLYGDHLGSTALSTTNGAFGVGQSYYGYGNYRSGGSLPTNYRYTDQELDIATAPTSGLPMYYDARFYDRTSGQFISPDTLIPDPTSVWDYNRFAYVRGNPLKYNDPSGHETSKPDWWPDFAPYIFDLPDGMTQQQFIEWLSENNIPTTWGVQLGIDGVVAPYIGYTVSLEGAYMFNWLSGEVMAVANSSAGLYTGTPDFGGSGHAGFVIVAGASRIDASILGISRYTSGAAEIEVLPFEAGLSTTWSRSADNLGNAEIVVPSGDFIDRQMNRTVDALSVNLNAGVDIVAFPLQLPETPADFALVNGLTQTSQIFGFNLYAPFQNALNWLTGN